MKSIDNVLLMSCRSPYLDDAKVYPPLGILYLKSAAEQELPGVNIDIRDDYDLDDPSIFKPYDLIGISVMTPQREESLKILNTIKTHYPDKKVAIGGPHAFHYFNDVMKEPYDFIVPKDGQRSLVKIIRGKADRIELDNMTPEEWANQPRPDRTSQKAKELLATYHYKLKDRESSTMLTALGCPRSCTFCEDANTMVRWSDFGSIKRELDDIKNLGYGGVYIFDDIFALVYNKTEKVAQELKKRDLIYRCNGQAKFFTQHGDKWAKMLSETGCAEIAFGHETGSQKILDNIKKHTTVEQNYKSVEYAKKHGIYVKSFILLGLPGETWSTLRETEQFIKNADIDDFQCAVYMPFKGTQIRDAIDRGEDVDLQMMVEEVSGAYGIKGGETAYEVRTKELSALNLKQFRNYLVDRYKPRSHKSKWQKDDKFRQTHEVTKTEYNGSNKI